MPDSKRVEKSRNRFLGYVAFLFLGLGVGFAIGYYVLPPRGTGDGTSVSDIARGTVMIERYARGLGRAMVYGAAGVLCTAMICLAYVVKPRGRKD